MTWRNFNGLPGSARTVMMTCVAMVALAALWPAAPALAQQSPPRRDDLDVTMQILVDPAAKTPDEVVRRIPLPAQKGAESKPAEQKDQQKSDAADKGQERAREAQELGREMSDNAKDKSKDATEQREEARRAVTEHGHPNPKPPDPPGRPTRPPRT
jgi:hypothetical protein